MALLHCLQDADRCAALTAELEDIHLDFSRQNATVDTIVRLSGAAGILS